MQTSSPLGLAAQRAALVQGQNMIPEIDPRVSGALSRAKEFMMSARDWSQPQADPRSPGADPAAATPSQGSVAGTGSGPYSGPYSTNTAGRVTSPDQLSDREILARTIQMEAGNQGEQGMMAVGATIVNRVGNKQWPNSIREVILQPLQFSPWNSWTGGAGGEQGSMAWQNPASQAAYAAADAVIAGRIPDSMRSYTHFVNHRISNPGWTKNLTNHGNIGAHTFYGPSLAAYGQ